jgi:serine/threonine protein kinase
VVGKTLGHYKILEPLGAGAMGEVYRARDTTLKRDVAVKVLPEDVATDQDRLARFEREAKLLASLNHANIAAIYGLEDEGDQRFIVMEVVEGKTRAERIARSGRRLPRYSICSKNLRMAS